MKNNFKARIRATCAEAWEIAQEARMNPARFNQIINNSVIATTDEIRRIETALFRVERGADYDVCSRLTWRENDVPGCLEHNGSIINSCKPFASWCLCDYFAKQATIKALEKMNAMYTNE